MYGDLLLVSVFTYYYLLPTNYYLPPTTYYVRLPSTSQRLHLLLLTTY